MIITTDAATLESLWAALRDHKPQVREASVARIVAAIVERGWAPTYRVEDLLHDMGVAWFWREPSVNTLFGVPQQTVFDRPKAGSGWAMGSDETAAADVAFILIQIERLGFAIDPSPLVDALRPALLEQQVVTKSDLHVLWYPKERHRMEALTVGTPDTKVALGDERTVLPTGYKVDLERNRAWELLSFTVAAPKYRKPRR